MIKTMKMKKKEVSEGKQDNNMDQEDEGDLFQRDFLPNEKNLKKRKMKIWKMQQMNISIGKI